LGKPPHQAPALDRLRGEFERYGQGHVFRFWERLSAVQRQRLLDQATTIDLPELSRAIAHQRERAETPLEIEPVEIEPSPDHGGDPTRRAAGRGVGE
jgi:UDP-N-acetylglucosamine/UDP-N-acetylgalactosamine diphosphorylase